MTLRSVSAPVVSAPVVLAPIVLALAAFASIVAAPLPLSAQSPRVQLELKGGPAWQSSNDATIALSQGSTSSRKDDVGFVPLLHLAGDWHLGSDVKLSLDVDGLAGGPGRAIDGSAKLGYDLDDEWSVRAGYRTVEGGPDVDEVYAFAWINYAVASVVWRW